MWSYWSLVYSLILWPLTFILSDSIYLASEHLLIHLSCNQYALNTHEKWGIKTELITIADFSVLNALHILICFYTQTVM